MVPLPLFTAVPLAGGVTLTTEVASMVPSESVSLATTLMVTGTPMVVAAESGLATGRWLLIEMTTVATLEVLPELSFTVYVNDADGIRAAVGVYRMVPLAFTTAVPLVGGDTIWTLVTTRVPSTSVSLASTGMVIGTLGGVATKSLLATGGALTATVTVALFETVPRLSFTL